MRIHAYTLTLTLTHLQQAMSFMRGVSIMITPHGANIGNTAFMLPGSALLEVQPLKCAKAGKMHAYEHTSNVVSSCPHFSSTKPPPLSYPCTLVQHPQRQY